MSIKCSMLKPSIHLHFQPNILRILNVNMRLKSFWQCTDELTQNGINSDTEKDQLCIFSSPDCQSNHCCLSSPWQVTNYGEHQQAPSQSIYLDSIIIISRATPDAPGMSQEKGEGCDTRPEPRPEGGLSSLRALPTFNSNHLNLSILTY